MKLKKTDVETINYRNCEKKGCEDKAEAIFHGKFLCESHFREKKPLKESNYARIRVFYVDD